VKSLLDDEVEPCTKGRQVQPPGPESGAIPKKTVKVRMYPYCFFPSIYQIGMKGEVKNSQVFEIGFLFTGNSNRVVSEKI
jgi:hypothetical protein